MSHICNVYDHSHLLQVGRSLPLAVYRMGEGEGERGEGADRLESEMTYHHTAPSAYIHHTSSSQTSPPCSLSPSPSCSPFPHPHSHPHSLTLTLTSFSLLPSLTHPHPHSYPHSHSHPHPDSHPHSLSPSPSPVEQEVIDEVDNVQLLGKGCYRTVQRSVHRRSTWSNLPKQYKHTDTAVQGNAGTVCHGKAH